MSLLTLLATVAAHAGPRLASCSVERVLLPAPKTEAQIVAEALRLAPPGLPGSPSTAFRVDLVFDDPLPTMESLPLGFAVDGVRADNVGGMANTLGGLFHLEPPLEAPLELLVGGISTPLGTLEQCGAGGPALRLVPPVDPDGQWHLETPSGQRELSTRVGSGDFALGPRSGQLALIYGRSFLFVYDTAADRLIGPLRSRFFGEGADAQSGRILHPVFLERGAFVAGQQVDDGLFLFDLRAPGVPREVFPTVRTCSGLGSAEEGGLYVVAAGEGRSRFLLLSGKLDRIEVEALSEQPWAAPDPPDWLARTAPGGSGAPCTQTPLRDYAREHLGDRPTP